MVRLKDKPYPIDLYAGQKLREARTIRGLSQQELGQRLDQPVTFQQVQKYENGTNRIAASRLYEFAKALKFPLTYFLPPHEGEAPPALSAQDVQLLETFRPLPADIQQTLLTLMTKMEQR